MGTDEAKKCPICVDGRRNPEHLVCSECFTRFNNDKKRAERNGKVWLAPLVKWVRVKVQETLVRLQSELDLAVQQKKKFYPRARQMAEEKLIADGAFSVEPTELNRQAGKTFGILLGDSGRAGEIFGILNNNPSSIAMIEAFLADIEGLTNKNENETTKEQVTA